MNEITTIIPALFLGFVAGGLLMLIAEVWAAVRAEKRRLYRQMPEARKARMNNLIDVKITFYLEIKNADVFGGAGSVGYAEINFSGFPDGFDSADVNAEAIDDFFERKAVELNISSSDIRLISRDEYEACTADEEKNDMMFDTSDFGAYAEESENV